MLVFFIFFCLARSTFIVKFLTFFFERRRAIFLLLIFYFFWKGFSRGFWYFFVTFLLIFLFVGFDFNFCFHIIDMNSSKKKQASKKQIWSRDSSTCSNIYKAICIFTKSGVDFLRFERSG